MTLPPALLARLRKRGIVKDAQEEIIAESYDDDEAAPVEQSKSTPYATGCPNKSNPYHICLEFCFIHWGEGVVPESRRDPSYDRLRQRMLRKYPLPIDWKEVYDPGVGRYYYWNTDTDDVCWLSPTHPRARIGPAAAKLAKIEWDRIQNENKARDQARKKKEEADTDQRRPWRRGRRAPTPEDAGGSDGEDVSDKSGGSDAEDNSTPMEERRRKPVSGRRKIGNDLDPMDPASYSDVPRGSWSTGLEMKGDAKTGVDTTAVGPLFQQRPYPAPGAVLRQNKEIEKKKPPPKPKGPMIGPTGFPRDSD